MKALIFLLLLAACATAPTEPPPVIWSESESAFHEALMEAPDDLICYLAAAAPNEDGRSFAAKELQYRGRDTCTDDDRERGRAQLGYVLAQQRGEVKKDPVPPSAGGQDNGANAVAEVAGTVALTALRLLGYVAIGMALMPPPPVPHAPVTCMTHYGQGWATTNCQ